MLIGYALCGSFCTFKRSIAVMEQLKANGHDILPIMSETAYSTDTRFGKASDICKRISDICGHDIIHTVADAEPLGPKTVLDALIISPCTGNTLAKISHGITDTSVTMACKAHQRCDRPVLIALASNDALSGNLENLARLLKRRSVYLTPLEQDDPVGKPHSLVAKFELIPDALTEAMNGKQLRPLFV